MKAIVKATGDILDVKVWASQEYGEFLCYYDGKGGEYSKYELDFNTNNEQELHADIDWNEKLIQLSGMAMAGMLANSNIGYYGNIADYAVELSKELIENLKKEIE